MGLANPPENGGVPPVTRGEPAVVADNPLVELPGDRVPTWYGGIVRYSRDVDGCAPSVTVDGSEPTCATPPSVVAPLTAVLWGEHELWSVVLSDGDSRARGWLD